MKFFWGVDYILKSAYVVFRLLVAMSYVPVRVIEIAELKISFSVAKIRISFYFSNTYAARIIQTNCFKNKCICKIFKPFCDYNYYILCRTHPIGTLTVCRLNLHLCWNRVCCHFSFLFFCPPFVCVGCFTLLYCSLFLRCRSVCG